MRMLKNIKRYLKFLFALTITYLISGYALLGSSFFNQGEMNRPNQRSVVETQPALSHPAIFCVILSKTKNLDTKAKVVYNAWGHKCSDYRIVSLIPGLNLTNDRIDTTYDNLFKVLKPEGLFNDTYGNLTYKVLLAFEDAYKIRPDFDWFLKADDDTFIFYDNLRDFAANKNRSDPITFGYDFKVNVPGGYHAGGAGYLLSNEAMKRLMLKWRHSMHLLQGPFKGVEDVEVASLLRTVNVSMGSSLDDKGRERFHVLNFMRYYTGNLTHWIHGYAKNPVKIVRD
jgi:glycoprotein-N-acetylgalactosamine 3-beta-galactosyltransferase